jgi:sugar lactone lactonase YvrE
MRADGTLINITPVREGLPRDYGFVRDGAGNIYWADRSGKTTIKKRSPDGKITTHATADNDFRAVPWMTATRDGVLFLMDGGDLRRVAPDGKVTTVVNRLSGQKPPPAGVGDRNYHMGLWTDKDGSAYVAVARERLVLRVGADGKADVFARSGESWSPSGGMFDSDGNLWLLEYNAANAVRARRIGRDGRERTFEAPATGRSS